IIDVQSPEGSQDVAGYFLPVIRGKTAGKAFIVPPGPHDLKHHHDRTKGDLKEGAPTTPSPATPAHVCNGGARPSESRSWSMPRWSSKSSATGSRSGPAGALMSSVLGIFSGSNQQQPQDRSESYQHLQPRGNAPIAEQGLDQSGSGTQQPETPDMPEQCEQFEQPQQSAQEKLGVPTMGSGVGGDEDLSVTGSKFQFSVHTTGAGSFVSQMSASVVDEEEV
ncbi:hypothetical protein HK102_008243, partial [Quaeritorhiza haematococci]